MTFKKYRIISESSSKQLEKVKDKITFKSSLGVSVGKKHHLQKRKNISRRKNLIVVIKS